MYTKNTPLHSIRVNHGLVLAGWGAVNKGGNTPAKLQHTRVVVENQTLCNNKYDTDDFALSLELELFLPDLIQPNLICAASEVYKCSLWRKLFYTYLNFFFYSSLVQVPVQGIVEGL